MAEELAVSEDAGYFGNVKRPRCCRVLRMDRRRLRSVIWKQWKRGVFGRQLLFPVCDTISPIALIITFVTERGPLLMNNVTVE